MIEELLKIRVESIIRNTERIEKDLNIKLKGKSLNEVRKQMNLPNLGKEADSIIPFK